jgi:glutamine synthetase
MQTPEQDFVMKTIESRDVHFIRFWFCDVLGAMKSFAIVPDELEGALTGGMGFDGSCIKGFADEQESDLLAYPDPSTFQVLPWRPQSDAVARMFCNIKMPDGSPSDADPRNVLERAVDKAANMGYIFNVGPELEYFYFKDDKSTEVLDTGSFFDLTSLDSASDLRRDTVLTLEKMGIPVEYSHHEKGPSQHEIDLRYSDALSMADAVMTYKQVVKEIATKHGVYASFMPKPMTDAPGSGMHMHMSLSDFDGNNVFYDKDDPQGYHLSKIAKHFIAGVLKYAPEFCLVTNQYVNSYKRLVADSYAPVELGWARNNRSAVLRVPGYRPDTQDAVRVELRNPDPAANPYLAFAAVLSAGLAGIEQELEPPSPIERASNNHAEGGASEAAATAAYLPQNLGAAIEEFEKSELMKEVLGERIHGFLVDFKKAEWRKYLEQVSPWELNRLLAVL